MATATPLYAIIPQEEYQAQREEHTKALQAALDDVTAYKQEMAVLTREALDAQEVIRTQNEQLTVLKAQLEAVTKPPVNLPASIFRIVGYTIENSKVAPSKAQYDKVKKAMEWGKKQGFNLFRMFLNPTEMRTHARPGLMPPPNLIAYGASLGLAWMPDTMDTIVKLLPSAEALKQYCIDARTMGAVGFYFNDADRKDLPIDTLKAMVQRVRAAVPGMPIYGSLLGSANTALYKTIFDRVEVQTFGTDAELIGYLRLNAIPCLDLRKPLTVDDLKKKAAIILQNRPWDLFFYTDETGDYEAMPDTEDAVIRDLINKLKFL